MLKLRTYSLAALAALALGLCAWRAHDQVGFWTDSGTLFTHALAVTDGNFYAHANLNIYFTSKGRLDEAIAQFDRAVANHQTVVAETGPRLLCQHVSVITVDTFWQPLPIHPTCWCD